MSKSGVEYLARHPGWRTSPRRRKVSSKTVTITVDRNMLSQLIDSARARAGQFDADFDPFNPEAFEEDEKTAAFIREAVEHVEKAIEEAKHGTTDTK